MTTSTLQSQWQRLYAPAADGGVRGARLELARPADWTLIGTLWRGVQADLGWPAPAIAVNGRDGYQLCFAFAAPLAAAQALALLAELRRRYLGHVRDERLALSVIADAGDLPPRQTGDEQWSAFVAPDLAPVFAETPWLDVAPSIEGQAELLARLAPIAATAWQDLAPPSITATAAAEAAGTTSDPRAFLLRVMNDEAAPLALRIEAAKALL